MRIGVISDIHCVDKDRERYLATLDTVVSGLSDVDYVVLLGDQITDADAETDRELVGAVADQAGQVDAPVRAVPGNHDIMNLSPEEAVAPFGHEPFGKDTVDGHDMLFLDTSAPRLSGSRGELPEEQLTFLQETLAEVDDALLFVHHPIHYHDISDNPWFGEYPERGFCSNKKEIGRILQEEDGVRAVFNGHLHEGDHTLYEGIDHVTVPPFAKGCPAERDKVSGKHAVVEVGEESIEVDIRTPEEKAGSYTL